MPWIGLSVGNDRSLSFCAENRLGIRAGGKILRLGGTTLTRAWKSSWLRGVRRKMARGARVAGCESCDRREAAGERSFRQLNNENWGSLLQDAQALDHPAFLCLKLGNLCNLSCRMCSPENSWRAADPLVESPRPPVKSGIAWDRSPSTWREIEALAPHLRMAILSGGEPFLIPETQRFLKRCAAAGRRGSLAVAVDTNLTRVPDRLLRHVARACVLNIQASLDGFGAANDYIRYPSRWKTVAGNFQRLAGIAPLFLNVMTTIQVYNVLDLADLLRYIEGVALGHGRRIRWEGQIVESQVLGLSGLPRRVLALGARRLREFRAGSRLCREDAGFRRSVDAAAAAVSRVRPRDVARRLRVFYAFTRAWDLRRGQSFEAVFPDLHRMLRGAVAAEKGA